MEAHKKVVALEFYAFTSQLDLDILLRNSINIQLESFIDFNWLVNY